VNREDPRQFEQGLFRSGPRKGPEAPVSSRPNGREPRLAPVGRKSEPLEIDAVRVHGQTRVVSDRFAVDRGGDDPTRSAVPARGEARRHGYGEALLRSAVAEEQRRTGIQRMILQSTEAGHELYVRMGFRPVANFSVYLTK